MPRARRPRTIASAAFSRSASAQTIVASLPPSSRWIFFSVSAPSCGQADSHGRAARHGDQAHDRASRETLPDELARPGDHLVRGAGEPGLLEDRRDPQEREGAGAGGLGDHRVARRQRGRGLVGVQLHGVVEGNDRGDDAEWLADGHGEMPLVARHRVHRDGAAENPPSFLRESAEDPGRDLHLVPGLADRLAVLPGQEHGELFLPVLHGVRGARQDGRALVRGHRAHAPASRHGSPQSEVHVSRGCNGDSVDDVAVPRVANNLGLTVAGIHPLAVDEHFHVRSPGKFPAPRAEGPGKYARTRSRECRTWPRCRS